jgi:hypothetical protein
LLNLAGGDVCVKVRVEALLERLSLGWRAF